MEKFPCETEPLKIPLVSLLGQPFKFQLCLPTETVSSIDWPFKDILSLPTSWNRETTELFSSVTVAFRTAFHISQQILLCTAIRIHTILLCTAIRIHSILLCTAIRIHSILLCTAIRIHTILLCTANRIHSILLVTGIAGPRRFRIHKRSYNQTLDYRPIYGKLIWIKQF